MATIVLVIHLLLALGLVGVVLAQNSEGGLGSLGGGGGGGGGGGMGGLLGNRTTANLLTRTTAILAGSFMVTSLALAILAGGSGKPQAIVTETPASESPASAPASAPASGAADTPAPAATPEPAAPSGPTVPQSQ